MPATLRRCLLVLCATVATLLGPAVARAETLVGVVGTNDAYSITLKHQDGSPVTSLTAGTYQIEVHDNSAIHDFHLSGPGVNEATGVDDVTTVTWTVTLQAGTYSFVCDPHAPVMHGQLTVTAAPPPTATLTVAVNGDGRVTSDTGGIACPGTCSATLPLGTVITLSATPGASASFDAWSGACSGTGGCQVTMNGASQVSAGFVALPGSDTLSVAVSGPGSVASAPAGIACPSTCAATYPASTQVTLTATPGTGAVFAGWSGPCSGTGACTVAASAGTVTATFAGPTTPPGTPGGAVVALTVRRSGSGSGTVTSSPGGIACGASCAGTFALGSAVTLTAAADAGSTFAGWSGACSGSTATCQVTLSNAADATATFNRTAAQRPAVALTVGAVRWKLLHPKGGRRVTVTFRVSLAASARLRLLKGTRVLAGRTVSVRAGLRALALTLPKAAHGRTTLQLRVKDGRGRTRTVTRLLHL